MAVPVRKVWLALGAASTEEVRRDIEGQRRQGRVEGKGDYAVDHFMCATEVLMPTRAEIASRSRGPDAMSGPVGNRGLRGCAAAMGSSLPVKRGLQATGAKAQAGSRNKRATRPASALSLLATMNGLLWNGRHSIAHCAGMETTRRNEVRIATAAYKPLHQGGQPRVARRVICSRPPTWSRRCRNLNLGESKC